MVELMVDGQELTVAFSPDLDRHQTWWQHAARSSQSPLKEPRHARRDARDCPKDKSYNTVVVCTSRELTAGVRTTRRSIFREDEYSSIHEARVDRAVQHATEFCAQDRIRVGSRLTGYVSGVSQDVFVIFVILTRSSVYTQYPASSREKKLPIKVSRFDVDVSFSNCTERIALASFPTHSYTNAK
jgi:hypothetical protein